MSVPDQKAQFASERQLRRAAQKRTRHQRSILLAAIAVVAVLALAVLGDLGLSAGRVHAGVSVDGVSVGGMKPAAAKAKLARELPRKAAKGVTVVSEDSSWTVQPADVGLSFDYDEHVSRAMAYGRAENTLQNAWERLAAWVRPVSLEPSATADPAKLKALLDQVAAEVEVPPVDAMVTIKGAGGTVKPSVAGVGLVRDAFSRQLLAAFVGEKKTIALPLAAAPARVSDAEAQAALDVARQMMSAPVSITFDEKTWTVEPEKIGSLISFRTAGEAETATLEPYIDPEGVSEELLPLIGSVGRPARDASFSVSNGTVSIVPSQDGVGPDVDGLSLELTQVTRDPARARTVALRTKRTEAKITTEKARTMGIKERLSRYTTTYAASNKPRVNNIHTLADSLDGTLVAPGATFSFNQTVGERTAAKGYQEAPAIVDGKLVPQLGGGICQVGTTIFNAVYESGLPVVQRKNHSFYISHYPKGRDATVSWGGPDFKFKNDTPNWVLVVAGYTNSSLTIALYGSDPGYEVMSETGEWTNEKPFKTEEQLDPTLPKGARIVEDPGVTGRTITVKRFVRKDGELLRTDTFTSVYRPKVEIVRVGTKAVKPKTTTTTTP